MNRRPKTIGRWVKTHRASIDAAIRAQVPNVGRLNDDERRDWVLNDESLYTWARSEGVEL